jgi:hypothetical protein
MSSAIGRPRARRTWPDFDPRASLWLRRRLTVLSPEAQALAPAIAVLALSAPLHWAAALSDLGEDAAARAADELAQARVVEPGLPLRFVHPLVRSSSMTWPGPRSEPGRTGARRHCCVRPERDPARSQCT